MSTKPRILVTTGNGRIGARPAIWVGLTLGTLALAVALRGAPAVETPPTPRVMPVQVATLRAVDHYRQARIFTGQVVARRVSDLSFKREDLLVSIQVDEGQRVERGAVIARLETGHLEIRLKRLRARQDETRARLDEMIAGPRKEQIAAARAEVRALRAQLKLRQILRERRRKLVASDTIPQEDLDRAIHGADAMAAKLEGARSLLAELLAGTRKERIRAQRARLEQIGAQIADLEIDLRESTIRAPFSGSIARRWLDEGTVVAAGRKIVRLMELAALEARVGIPVEVAAGLKIGSEQQLMIGKRKVLGRLRALLPQLDARTRTVTAVLNLSGTGVLPGQIARLLVDRKVAANGYWVPTNALTQAGRGLWAVYLVVDGRVQRATIEVLHTESDRVLVRGTLRDGDRLILSGAHRIVQGQHVRQQR